MKQINNPPISAAGLFACRSIRSIASTESIAGAPSRPAEELIEFAALILELARLEWAALDGSLSGLVNDPSGAAISGAELTLTDAALETEFTATSDEQGFYSFPALASGQYDLTIEAPGFRTHKRTNFTVDTDSAITVDTVAVFHTFALEVECHARN